MRSEHPKRASVADTTAPGDAGKADRTAIAAPIALWLETAESMFKWYGAMVRLAFRVGQLDSRSESHTIIAPSAAVKPEESSANPPSRSPGGMHGSGEAPSSIASVAPASVTPAESSPAVALHSVRTAPVKLRPKGRKTAPRGKNGARSSKMSSVKRRHRRAA